MTTGEMAGFTKRFHEILNGSPQFKFSRLETLSNDLLMFDPEDEHVKAMYYSVVEEMCVA